MITEILKMFGLVILQNASFTLVSRARNSKSLWYHGIASVMSNGIWLLVIMNVVQNFKTPILMWTYLVASVIGSVTMHWFLMKYVEKPKVKPSRSFEDIKKEIIEYVEKNYPIQSPILRHNFPKNGWCVKGSEQFRKWLDQKLIKNPRNWFGGEPDTWYYYNGHSLQHNSSLPVGYTVVTMSDLINYYGH